MRVILLLGAALRSDGTSPALADRTDHAAGLYARGEADAILASGGKPRQGRTEAEAAAARLLALGVPAEAIHLETRSRNTWENVALSKPLLEALGTRETILVTDRFHMPRARLTARRFGLAVRPMPAPPSPGRRLLAPRLREAPAIVGYVLRPRHRD